MKKVPLLSILIILLFSGSVMAQSDTVFVWFYSNNIDYKTHIDTNKYSNKLKKIKFYLVSTNKLKSKIKEFNSLSQLDQDLQDEVPYENYVFLEQVNPRNQKGMWIESFSKLNLYTTRKILSIEEFEQYQFYNEFTKPIYLVIPDSSTNSAQFIKVRNFVY